MEGLRDRAQALRKSTDKAIIANLAMQIHTQSYFLRGFSEYLMDLVLNQKLIEAIMDRVLEIFVERTEPSWPKSAISSISSTWPTISGRRTAPSFPRTSIGRS